MKITVRALAAGAMLPIVTGSGPLDHSRTRSTGTFLRGRISVRSAAAGNELLYARELCRAIMGSCDEKACSGFEFTVGECAIGSCRYWRRVSSIALPVFVRYCEAISVVRKFESALRQGLSILRPVAGAADDRVMAPNPALLFVRSPATGPRRWAVPATAQPAEVTDNHVVAGRRQRRSSLVAPGHDATATLRRRWSIAVTLAQFVGLAGPTIVDGWTTHASVLATVAWVTFAGAVGGVVLGAVQAEVLTPMLAGLRSRDWVAATAAGAVLAWGTALVPIRYGAVIARWPARAQTHVVVASAVAVVSAVGIAQWVVLRRHSDRAVLWSCANVVAQAAGLTAFALITTPLWHSRQSHTAMIAIGVLGCLAVAVAVAAVTGAFLPLIVSPAHRIVPSGRTAAGTSSLPRNSTTSPGLSATRSAAVGPPSRTAPTR